MIHELPKLGKEPHKVDPRTFKLEKYADLSAPPSSYDWTEGITKWGMLLNDTIGDCTVAGALHMRMSWAKASGEKPFYPTDANALHSYMAVSGYNPKTGDNDNGAAELDVLNHWRNLGIAGHKIGAFASVNYGNQSHLQSAIYMFGGSYIGIQLPISAQGQSSWEVPPGGLKGAGAPGSWGGHAVPILSYDASGVTVVTWGALLKASWDFIAAYCEEAWAIISPDFITGAKPAPNGFDLTTLQTDINSLE